MKQARQRKTNTWYCLYVEIWKRMMQTNLFTKQQQTHRLREWTYGYQGRVEGRTYWEFGTDMYTLLYLKQITNYIAQGTLPLCNNLNGKRIRKRTDTCICITESLCYTPETNTTLLILFQYKKKIFFNYIFHDIKACLVEELKDTQNNLITK